MTEGILDGLVNSTITAGQKLIGNPAATAIGGAVIGSALTGAAIVGSSKLKSKRRKSRKKKSYKRSKRSRKKRTYRYARTAGKRKDTSKRRIRMTKNGQPYVIMSNGRARFIKKSSARNSRRRKGGRY